MPMGMPFRLTNLSLIGSCCSEWMSQDITYCREVFMTTFKQPAALRSTSVHVDKGDYRTFCLCELELIA